jgi:predicted ATPase/class 3 adenylate cyclase
MEQRELIGRILQKFDHIMGKENSLSKDNTEQAVFDKLAQVEKIISSIQKYLPKRVIDKILLNPEGVKVEGERRQVTILFGDLSGFTAMSETMDPEQVVEVVNQYFDTMVEIASRYGGHIDKFMGDALMVLFGAPVAHEDDPLRACLAAIEMLEAMDRFSAERKMELAMSIGLNTGEVVALNVGSKERMEYTVIGDGVNLAARLEKVATARQCVIGENTYRQVKGKIKLKKLKPVMVKGKSKPQNVYLIMGRMEDAGKPSSLRSGSIKLVGRMAEMEGIKQSIDAVVNSKGRVVAITGDPGVGKSRVAKELELLAKDKGFRFTKGKCYSYSNNIAYLPFVRQLTQLFSIEERDSSERKQEKIQEILHSFDLTDFEPFLGSLLGLKYAEAEDLDPEKRKRKTFEGIQELYIRQSRKNPLAIAFEDLQWADTLSLELLEHLVEIVPNEALLICADFRPELALPFIAKPQCHNINLRPLEKQETWQMISALSSVSDVDDAVFNKLVERTEGNPLFIEEVVRHLISRRLVKRDGENLVPSKRFGKMTLPNTVSSVVLGRIDKLGEELRRTLQYAAVIGKEFDRAILAKLLKESEEKIQQMLDNLEHFEGLLYSKLVDTRRIYEFHSTTTHEAAYSTLLKQRRKELHGKVARTLEGEYKENLFMHLEDLAHHYYNSSDQDKAVNYLHKAGDKSRGLYANHEALEFYEKCLTVLKAIKQSKDIFLETAEILATQSSIYRLIGEMDRALKNINKSIKILSKEKNNPAYRKYMLESGIIHAMLGETNIALTLWKRVYTDANKYYDNEAIALSLQNQGLLCFRNGDAEKAIQNYQLAIKSFNERTDKKHLARLYSNIAQAYEMKGDIEKSLEYYQNALNIAKEINYLEGIAAYNNNLGPLFLTGGEMERAEESLSIAYNMAKKIGDRRTESLSSGNIGIIKALTGEYHKALEYFENCYKISLEIGDIGQQKNMLDNIGSIHQIWGNAKQAIEHHSSALDIVRKVNDRHSEMEILRNLGLDYIISGNYKHSLEHIIKADQVTKEVGDPRMQAYVKVVLGSIYHKLGQLENADRIINQALDEARNVRDPEVILAAARALVELKLDMGDLVGAEEHINRLLGLAERTQNKREMSYGLLNLAQLFLAKKDLNEMPQVLSESMVMAKEIEDKVLLGRIYLLFTQKALIEGNIREAEDYLNDAKEMVGKTGSPYLDMRMHWCSGKLLKLKGLEEQDKQENEKVEEIIKEVRDSLPEEMQETFYDFNMNVLK